MLLRTLHPLQLTTNTQAMYPDAGQWTVDDFLAIDGDHTKDQVSIQSKDNQNPLPGKGGTGKIKQKCRPIS